MRILLVKPPEQSNLNFGSFSLAVLAGYIKDISDIAILDVTDLTVSNAVKATLHTSPDIIGITAMGWSSVEPVKKLIEGLRKEKFSSQIIIGGHGATVLPKPLLEAGADAVVLGEGELTFSEIVQCGISESVPGLALLREGSVILTTNRPLIESLDSLPQPRHDLIKAKCKRIFSLETSRGCPHRCAFCETSSFFRHTWRARSPEVVAKDIGCLVEDFEAVIVHIVDDNFTADPFRALNICKLVRDGPLPLFFLFAARSDELLRFPDLIPSLAEARFLRANIGVETIDLDLAKNIRKPISYDTHKQAFGLMRKAGIYTFASFIIGLPGETETIRESYVDMAVDLEADSVQFLPFQPLPGTPLGKENPKPELWCVEESIKANREYEKHPLVIERLLDTARECTIRGMLARENLNLRLRMNILDRTVAKKVEDTLREIESGLLDRPY